jgi:hypothetical protein
MYFARVAVTLGEHNYKKDIDCHAVGGEHYCAPPGTTLRITVEATMRHPGYHFARVARRRYNDVALIRLSELVTFTRESLYTV